MDSSEFPSLSDSTASHSNNNVEKSTLLGSSWAEVAQPHSDEEDNASTDNKNAWETPKKPVESALPSEEFPTPQESAAQVQDENLPTSGGVSDLLHKETPKKEQEKATPTKQEQTAPKKQEQAAPTKQPVSSNTTEDFPTLQESAAQVQDESVPTSGGVGDLLHKDEENKENVKPETTNASFADIAGHEKRQAEEFPTPQEAVAKSDASLPASGGVGDLLNNNSAPVEDTTQPPNPDRSFADVTSNKGFPTPEHDTTQEKSDLPPLSDLPDVKDMLKKPSVHVPPVPPSQSFAKMAAKEIPPEKRPLSERAQHVINNQPKEDPMAVNDENFPTLGQSNLMSEENASLEDKSMYSEISRFNQLNDDELTKQNEPKLAKSFADITSSNLENAPPSAIPHVDQHPVYDEETVYHEIEKREERKNHQVEYGNNEQLIKEEKDLDTLPKKIVEEELEKEGKTTEKSRDMEKKNGDALAVRLHTFDNNNTGVITIFDTILALYRLGYSWFTILPGAIFMHIRLSPMTSPHGFPFIYRRFADLILLPIYTRNLNNALAYKTPMLHQGKEEVSKMVETYGHKHGSTKGLGYWDGLRAMRSLEQNSLRWWQIGLWAVHRVQWTLAYTMLHEPKTNVVTAPTLISLSKED